MKLSKVIENPIMTEKSVAQSKEGTYSFKVALEASKRAVANEIKRLFNVDAVSVKTMIMHGEHKRVGRTRNFTKMTNWKKALVSLKKGQKIELFEAK